MLSCDTEKAMRPGRIDTPLSLGHSTEPGTEDVPQVTLPHFILSLQLYKVLERGGDINITNVFEPSVCAYYCF